MEQRRPPPPPPPTANNVNLAPPAPRKSVRMDANVLAQQMAAMDTAAVASKVGSSVAPSTSNQIHSDNSVNWVKDKDEVWSLYQITSQNTSSGTCTVKPISKTPKGDQKIQTLPQTEIFPCNSKVMPDMTSLHHIHEPAILHNLQEQSAARQAYTFMSTSALIAVNPLRRLDEPQIATYCEGRNATLAPHPYSIAESTYQNLCFSGKDQSIIIGGESGAGKTETAKIILKFLASRNQSLSTSSSAPTVSGSSDSLDVKLLRSSPILESFGNAKTSRNHNSSRFGKFMKLLFKPSVAPSISSVRPAGKKGSGGSSSLELTGAMIETYLLEKSRVTSQSDGECNFHIFYQLLLAAAANDKQLSGICGLLNLGGGSSASSAVQNFNILSNNNMALFRGIRDMCDLATVSTALSTVGLNNTQISGIYRILAGCLHLGNVAFSDVDTSEGTVAVIAASDTASTQALQHAATAYGCTVEALKMVLTQREVTTRGEMIIIPLKRQEAAYARDATVKAVYEAMFELIVKYINASLVNNNTSSSGGNNAVSKPAKPSKAGVATSSAVSPSSASSFIGVLDIFGFENFLTNEYEQLLINYANEALQNTFNTQIFLKEIELFKAENIDFSLTAESCPNNLACVELVSGKSSSVFSLLDNISRQPKPSDERFCEELHKAFSVKGTASRFAEYFPTVHKKDMKQHFQVRHYAGVVKYTVDHSSGGAESGVSSWIGKNNDSIPDGLPGLYASSTLPEFRQLNGALISFSESGGAVSAESSGKSETSTKRRTSVMMRPTIAAIFGKSMNELNALLLSTACHFIRCIKPNPQMQADLFDRHYVVEQLRALGILQACEVLKVCLPTRIPYSELLTAINAAVIAQVKPLLATEASDSDSLLVSCILKAYDISPDLFKLGRTMVFFKPGQLVQLEALLKGQGADQDPARIVNSIKETLAQRAKTMGAITKTERRLKEVLEAFSELEKRYDTFTNKYRNISPDVHAIELPPQLVQRISSIDGNLKQLRTKQKDLALSFAPVDNDVKNTRDAALMASSVEVKRQLAELETSIATEFTRYSMVNQQVQVLEESCGTVSAQFKATVENNDSLYDNIQDQITECEELSEGAKDDAERCQLDSAESKAKECATIISTVLQKTVEQFQEGLRAANAEYDKYEASSTNVDFSPINTLTAAINTALDTSIRNASAITTAINKLKLDTKSAAAKSNSKLPPAPSVPPPPVNSAPAFAPFDGTGAEATPSVAPQKPDKRASVNFSIKDLTALRKKSVTTSSEDATASDNGSTTSDSSGNSSVAAVRKLMEDLNKNKGSTGAASTAPSTPAGASGGLLNDSGLPVGWKEMLDKKSNRAYYVNTVTKERQWARPKPDGSFAPDTATAGLTPPAKARPSATAGTETSTELPPHWRSVLDKKSNRTYYVNDETKVRQWRRPEPPTSTTALGTEDDIQRVDRVSRRLNPQELAKLGSNGKSDANRSQKVAAARRASATVLDAETASYMAADSAVKHSVTFMNKIGSENKRGYLMKQSKFLGRWKKRYVVLSGSNLEYFDRPQDAAVAGSGKSFELTGSSLTSYTSTENCMCISNSSDASESSSWFLLAENEVEMELWMTAINGHIHRRYVAEHRIETDYWDDGEVALSFWKVPTSTAASGARRPVGIRSLPIVDGPRTGEGIFPGEVVEIVQVIQGQGGQRFLRLGDDRGWVFENHPSGNYAIMAPVPGTVFEGTRKYVYSDEFFEDLQIFQNPTCDSGDNPDVASPIGQHFGPGSEIVGSIELAVAPTPEEEDPQVFIKLEDGRGWVSMYHPVTGGKLLQCVSEGVKVAQASSVEKIRRAAKQPANSAIVSGSAKASPVVGKAKSISPKTVDGSASNGNVSAGTTGSNSPLPAVPSLKSKAAPPVSSGGSPITAPVATSSPVTVPSGNRPVPPPPPPPPAKKDRPADL